MTKEELAEKLNGREYGSEINTEEEREAESAGLVVVFGYSDDNVEFRGAINDELGCYGGRIFKLHKTGVLPRHNPKDCDCPFCGYSEVARKCANVQAIWGGGDDYSWKYETIIPHARFEIQDDGEPYCRGIVLDVRDLPTL